MNRARKDVDSLPPETVFYGAGKNLTNIISRFEQNNIPFNFQIWDINAEKIHAIKGRCITAPDFTDAVRGRTIVITISDKMIRTGLMLRLENLGANVMFHTDLYMLRTIGSPGNYYPCEFSEKERQWIDTIFDDGLTLVSRERLFSTLSSVKFAVENNIPGDFVECGVWRGGNSILAAAVLKMLGSNKKVWLFDTFSGFKDLEIDEIDKDYDYSKPEYTDSIDFDVSLSSVKYNFQRYGLLSDNIVFVQGDVMQTLDGNCLPPEICVLRLDTDWYASTKKELDVLYPRIPYGGILLIDDYGHCDGARAAVDEYFSVGTRPLLQYIDYTGRMVVKVK